MRITSDKESTKILKKFLTKIESLTFQDNWNGFGDVTVRIVSVGESSKYNWNESSYSRVLNIEVTAKKEGYHFSENKIPNVYSWGSTRMAFYKYTAGILTTQEKSYIFFISRLEYTLQAFYYVPALYPLIVIRYT